MRKRYILYIVVILLSIINIINVNNVSALSYSSNVGVGFTFSPTLSVSLSSSDLVISNLVPGSALDSNVINVSVASNASYGYTLSATVNGNNNLTHSNGTNVFSSIATNADLSSLDNSEDSNIWGYSYKDNTVETPAWSSYNGLSSSVSATLLDTNTNNTETGIDSIDFKIAAKASGIQPSGTYTSVINFIAVSNIAPISLLDSFIASGAEQLNGYFKMQDMTHSICANVDIEESELQLIDVRDNKIYWVAKLKDGNCWMTQNLDLDLSHEVALTSETSDIDPESYGKTIYTAEAGYSKDETTGIVSWLPSTIVEVDDGQGGTTQVQQANTIDMVWSSDTAATVPWWANDYNKPYSADAGDRYKYTDNAGDETVYISYNACLTDTNNDKAGCQHTHIGNYYNWTAAVASNNTSTVSGTQTNSICPKNWNLPANGRYGAMLKEQKVIISNKNYDTDGFLKIRTSPLYFVQSGNISGGSISNAANGLYWLGTAYATDAALRLNFTSSGINSSGDTKQYFGQSIRCIAE